MVALNRLQPCPKPSDHRSGPRYSIVRQFLRTGVEEEHLDMRFCIKIVTVVTLIFAAGLGVSHGKQPTVLLLVSPTMNHPTEYSVTRQVLESSQCKVRVACKDPSASKAFGKALVEALRKKESLLEERVCDTSAALNRSPLRLFDIESKFGLVLKCLSDRTSPDYASKCP